jgi:hypothetical protein
MRRAIKIATNSTPIVHLSIASERVASSRQIASPVSQRYLGQNSKKRSNETYGWTDPG